VTRHTQPIVAASHTGLRVSELLFCAFFIYVFLLRLTYGHPVASAGSWPVLVPLLPLALSIAERRSHRRLWSIARDWTSPLLVLLAYWSIDESVRPGVSDRLESSLVAWDRTILDEWGLRQAIEAAGTLIPAVLEVAYLVLYALPPLMVAYCYVRRERRQLEAWMVPFLAGTLAVYSLLPHFPSVAPRFAFPGEDLPRDSNIFRQLNVWVLSRGDIRSSVFPSGHVGVGFSAALATWLAGRRHRRQAWALLGFATVVWLTTIYSRYHYAADGLAALVVSGTVIAAYAAWVRRREEGSI
jgi:membrane-associated phospholipid phosphatase